MKSPRTLITICLVFTSAILLAQPTVSQRLMTVNVPFAFSVEGHSLPTGEYLVLAVTPERSIRFVSADGKHLAIVNTLPSYAKTPSANRVSCFTSTEMNTSSHRSGLAARM